MSRDKVNERINSRIAPAKNNKKSHTGLIVISGLVVVCILIGVIVLLVLGKDSKKAVNNVITPDNIEEVINQVEEKERTPIGYYQVTMNTEWEFPDGYSPSTNAYVENCVYNQHTVYFTIALKENPNDILYTSPYLEVGSHIDNIQLDTALPAGTYDAVIKYMLVDEEYNDLSSVSVTVQLTFND